MPGERSAGGASQEAARKLVKRYNNAMFAIVGAWVGVTVLFWSRALGPMRPFDVVALETSAWGWLVAGVSAGAGAALLPRSYYAPRRFERSGKFYEALGIKAVRTIITDGDFINRLARRRDPSYRVHPAGERLAAALKASVDSERSHHALWWFGVASSLCAWSGGWIGWSAAMMIGNFVANLIPILLQRYTRARIYRMGQCRPHR